MSNPLMQPKIIYMNGVFRYDVEPIEPPPEFSSLPPGYYSPHINNTMMGEIVTFDPMKKPIVDGTVIMTAEQREVIDYIDIFFSEDTRKRYREIGLVWKTGILLHGFPGTGKTYSVIAIIDLLIRNGCIVFYSPPIRRLGQFIECARCGDDSIPIVAIYEDCEETFYSYDVPLMQILDGQESVDGFIIIGTTNDIDTIPERVWQRPSRFSKIIQFDYANEEVIKSYIDSKLGRVINQKDATDIAKECSKFRLVLDDVKYIALSAYALKRDVKEVLAERYSGRKKQ